MQQKVYLAGPISGCNYGAATDWREYAKSKLYVRDVKALSPMRHTEHLQDENEIDASCLKYGSLDVMSSPRGVMTRDRYDATTCDLLLVNLLGAQRVSIGTMMEIAWADLKRTPIVCAMESTGNPHDHAMVTEAIGFRVATLDEAIRVTLSVLCAS